MLTIQLTQSDHKFKQLTWGVWVIKIKIKIETEISWNTQKFKTCGCQNTATQIRSQAKLKRYTLITNSENTAKVTST